MALSLRTIPIFWRVFIAVATPLIIVIGLLLQLLGDFRQDEVQAKNVNTSVQLSAALGDLVHYSQRERAFSNVFVFTGGQKFRAEMINERKRFDQAITEYRQKIAAIDVSGLPEGVTEPLKDVDARLTGIAAHRSDIDDLKISRQETIDYYTAMVTDSLNLTRATTKSVEQPDFVRTLVGMAAVVQGKEQAALERSVIVMSLTNGCVNPLLDSLNQKLLYGQELSFTRAESYLGSEMWAPIQKSFDTFPRKAQFEAIRAEVEQNRVACLSSNERALKTDPNVWWEVVTARLDLLRLGQQEVEAQVMEKAEALAVSAQRSVQYSIAGLIGLVGLLLSLCFFLVRSITRPVLDLEKTIHEVGEANDLTRSLSVYGKDEISSIGTTYNLFIHDLREAFSSIQKSVAELKDTSAELTHVSTEVSDANGALRTGAETVKVNSQTLSKQVQQTTSLTTALADKAGKGSQSAGKANESLKSIRSTVTQSSSLVAKLSDRSNAIGEIIESISSIASQTNLLALNAAIEAARAGEAGRGFAVVADEVRKLAEESQSATDQIGTLIKGMREDIDQTVQQITLTTTQVSEGSDVIQDALVSLSDIAKELVSVTASISELATISNESMSRSQEMGASIGQNSERVDRALTVAKKLDETASRIDDLVKKFRV